MSDSHAMNLSSDLSKLWSELMAAFSARPLAFTLTKTNTDRKSYSVFNDDMRNTNTPYGEPNNVERGYR